MHEQKLIKTILYLLIAVFLVVGIWGIDIYKKAYVAVYQPDQLMKTS
jgi:hypothetical protein